MRRFLLSAAVMCYVLGAWAGSARAQTFPYDHIHLNVPDPAAAANWYEKNFGGRRAPEGPDRIMYGAIRLLFSKKAGAKPSSGSAVDHIGFSFADLDAKMKEFEAGGVKIVTQARDAASFFQAGIRGRSVGHAHRSGAGPGAARAASRSYARTESR